MSVEIDSVYKGGLLCDSTHGPSGQILTTDAPVDNGGRGGHFSPTDLMATALGTCALTVMGIVAQRNGWELQGARARVTKEMTASPARRIGALKLTITVPNAQALSSAARAKLEQAAAACPVKQSLHPDVKIAVEYVYQD